MNQDVTVPFSPVSDDGHKKIELPTFPPQHSAYEYTPFVQHARYPPPPPPPPPKSSSYHKCDLKHSSPIRPLNQSARIYKSCDPRDTQYKLPPLSDSRYIVEDCGNASPRLLKPCMQILPQNSSIQQKTQIPMGVMCTPLALPSEDYLIDLHHDDEDDHKECNLYPREMVPLVYPSFDEKEEILLESISCSHCKAYWNPYMKFENKLDEISIHCNFCGKKNHTKVSNAFEPASALEFGTVDYDLGEYTIYSENNKLGPIHVFAIDGNDREKFEVYLQSVAATVKKMDTEISMQLQHSATFHARNRDADEDHHLYPRIGFFIYLNDEILFPHWEWKRKSSFDEKSYKLTFSIMKDTEDPFSPIPITDWTFMLGRTAGLAKFYELIDHLPSKMESFIPLSDDQKCSGSLALQVLLDALSIYRGATGTLISTSRIRFGTRGERSTKLNTGTKNFSQQKPVISSNSDFFEKCGRKASSHGLSINIVFCASPDVIQHEQLDVGGIGLLLQQCNGSFKWIKYNSIDDAPHNILSEQLVLLIRASLTSVLEMHVTCSEGLSILSSTANLSSTKNKTSSSISLKQNNAGTNSCFAVELGFRVGGILINKRLPHETLACLQITTTLQIFGRRRLRVSTLGMKVSQCANEVFSSINADAMTAFLTQQAVSHVWKTGFQEIQKVKANIEIRLASLIQKLQSYRGPSNTESCNYLSLYQQGVCRSKIFAKELGSFSRNIKDMDDTVAYNLILANLVSPSNSLLFVLPAVYDLSYPSLFRNLVLENISYICLPESVSLKSPLNNERMYLIDGYTDFFIYICRSVDADTRADLISINENGRGQRQLRLSVASSHGKKIWHIIKQLQRCHKNSSYPWTDRPMSCGVSVVIASGGLGYREGFDSEIEHEIIALFNNR